MVSVTSHDETEPIEKAVESSSKDSPALAPSKKKLIIKPLDEESSANDEPAAKASSDPEPTIADLAKPDPLPGKTVPLPVTTEKAEDTTGEKESASATATDTLPKSKEVKSSKAKEPAKEKKEQPAPEVDMPVDTTVNSL